MKNFKINFLIIILIIFIDQLLKKVSPLKIKNYGASFNILNNYPLLLTIISILALVLFVYLLNHKKNRVGLTFLIAGTSSNLIDRLFLGYIIDYIPLPYLFTFNLADLANTIGIIILISNLWKN